MSRRLNQARATSSPTTQRFISRRHDPAAPDPQRAFGNQSVLRTLGGVVQRSPDDGTLKAYKDVYSYTEGDKVRWIDKYKVDFLGATGFDIFKAARDKGYSAFGSLFIVAHATVESDFGAGNWASKTHNYFSVMGGSDPAYKNAHGMLAVYKDATASFDGYIALLGKTGRWPATVAEETGLYFQSVFTPDDVNQAFRQDAYYKKDGGYAYNADPKSDYGAVLFERMQFVGGPLIVLVAEMAADAPKDAEQKPVLETYAAELRTAYADAVTKLTEHRAAKRKK